LPGSRFSLPAPRRPRPRDVALSLAAHALVVAGLLAAYRGWTTGEVRRVFAFFTDGSGEQLRAVPVRVPAGGAPARAGRPLAAVPAPTVAAPAAVPAVVGDSAGGVAGGVPGGSGTGHPGIAALTPLAGDARLWVRPLYIPGDGSRPIDMDSIVRRRLLEMAVLAESLSRSDSLSPARRTAPPRWIIERDGKKYGIDENAIHLGAFSIPTAVLALLPLPQGNIDQSRAWQRQMEVRADILRAAARAEAEDDFRRQVRAIRERRDRERQERREREQRQRAETVP
jgi:hypothetical protein